MMPMVRAPVWLYHDTAAVTFSIEELDQFSWLNDGIPEQTPRFAALRAAGRDHAPLVLAVALVGTVLGGLLVGYEPVGGDPDRLYRPLEERAGPRAQGGPASVLE